MSIFNRFFGKKETGADNSLGLLEVKKGLELLTTGNYKGLEHLYQNLSPDAKSLMLEGVAIPITNAKSIDDWCKKEPDSYISQLWQGVSYTGRAWNARTAALAKNVSDKRVELFFDFLEKAYESLRNSLNIHDNDPETCARMIRVLMGLSEDKDTILSYFDAAIEADPAHVTAHLMMINYLNPKWKGSIDEMNAFAKERLSATGDKMLIILPLFAMVETDLYFEMMNDPQSKNFFKDPSISKSLTAYYSDFEKASIQRPYKVLAYNYFSCIFYQCRLTELFKDARTKMQGNLSVYPWSYYDVNTVESLVRL